MRVSEMKFPEGAFRVLVMGAIESDRFVFVDECSSNTSLAPLYGWSRKGERAYQRVPRNWGKNITLISSIGKQRGMGASSIVEVARPMGRFSRPIWRMFCCPR